MKLYYSPGACSLSCKIIIKELNLNCQFEAVNLVAKITASGKDYSQINPKGSVPALVIDNEVLTENIAILEYLTETNNAVHLFPAKGDFKRYRVIEWLSYITSDVHKSCSPLFHNNVLPEQKETIFKPILKSKINYINEKLANKTYLMGEQFTIADAYLFVILRWLKRFNMDVADWPNVLKYFETIQKRPAVEKALVEDI